jgi:hypothetical protein
MYFFTKQKKLSIFIIPFFLFNYFFSNNTANFEKVRPGAGHYITRNYWVHFSLWNFATERASD